MQSRWSDQEARRFVERYAAWGEDVALRVYTSRLIGSEPALVMHGGGNTSVKSVHRDLLGDSIEAIYVKGSGWNLDSIEPPGLPGLDLAYLRRLRSLAVPLRRGDGEPAPHPPLRRGGAQSVGRDAAARLPAGEVHRPLARRRHPRRHQPGARRGVRPRGARRRRRRSCRTSCRASSWRERPPTPWTRSRTPRRWCSTSTASSPGAPPRARATSATSSW